MSSFSAVKVGKQLMAHRDRQLELQKEHEERIARMLERNKGFFFLSEKSQKTGFFFLSEKSQKTGTFPFLRFFARTFPSYDRHLLCYLFLYFFLFIEYLHDSIQQFFLFSQQLAYAVYTLAAAGSGLIYTSCTSLRRHIYLVYILAETSYFVGSSFQFLLSVLFIEPNIDDADNDYSISTLQKERQSDTRLPFYLIKFTSIKNNNPEVYSCEQGQQGLTLANIGNYLYFCKKTRCCRYSEDTEFIYSYGRL